MASSAIEGICESRFLGVREAFAENFARHGEVGAAVAVTIDGRPVVDLWAGHANAARTRPWVRDTIVNIASATKGPTAICTHRLADRGLLDLEAPAASYWPEFAQAGKAAIPVHMLLSHRAGLPAIETPLPTEALYDWGRMTWPRRRRGGSPAPGMGTTRLRSAGSSARWSGGSPERACPGAGGSIGFADPGAHIGFGYTMNQMQPGMPPPDSRAIRMIDALYASL